MDYANEGNPYFASRREDKKHKGIIKTELAIEARGFSISQLGLKLKWR